MLTVSAPAKLNLTLEVLAKRPDGFHEIRSVIQTINLGDSLSFQSSEHIEFKSNLPDWIPEESLVSKAASLLQQVTNCSKGATVEIKKRIPLMSGLGGDSSDAAAVLRGLNRLWELDLPPEKLIKLGRQLGSDVSFLLYGGTALLEGNGEIVTPLPLLPHSWVILVMPPVPKPLRKTKQLYDSLSTTDYTDGQITRRLVEELKAGQEFIPSLLFNTFENVAFAQFPGLDIFQKQMMKAGATTVHLAGTGPVLFTLVKDRAQAEELYIRLQHSKSKPYLAETSAGIDQTE